MTKFSWNEKLEKRLIIDRLNGIREQDDDGVKYRGFTFERLSAILTSCIKTSQNVRQSDLQNCIRHSLFRMQEGGFITAEQFLDDCELRLKQIQKAAQKKYVLVTRLTYHGKMPTRVFSLSGSTIDLSPRHLAKFSRSEKAGRAWAIEKLGKLRQYEVDSQLPFCTITTMGRSIEDAFQSSMAALDTFRGLVNLFFNRRKGQRFSSGIPPQPVNDLRLGLLQTLHSKDGLIHTDKIWYQLDYTEPRRPLDPSKHSEELLRFLRTAQRQLRLSPLGEPTQEALQRYAVSLDRRDWTASYKDLWSTLEFCTHTQKSNYDVTIRRAASSFRDVEYAQLLGNHLRYRRNRIVHSQFEEEESEVLLFQLKELVEPLLMRMLKNSYNLKSHQEFGELLDMPRSRATLEHRISLAKAALKYYSLS